MVNIILIGRLFFSFSLIVYLIATLHEAREKVKLAEETSDLSNIEKTSRKKKSTNKFEEPPQYETEQNYGKYIFMIIY